MSGNALLKELAAARAARRGEPALAEPRRAILGGLGRADGEIVEI